jgi:hypothetical protein
MDPQKICFNILAIIDAVFNTVELICYVTLYKHINDHDNTVAAGIVAAVIVDASVVRYRNRVNTISLYGQLSSWILELWFIVAIGLIATIFNLNLLREVTQFFRVFQFSLIPFIQIKTSPSIQHNVISKLI